MKNNLKSILKQKGVTQTMLSKMADVHITNISRFINNHSVVSLESLVKIAKVLNVTLDDLITIE